MAVPNRYETHILPYLICVEGWTREGATEESIAKKLGIAYSTFKEYKKKESALSDTLKNNRVIADFEVENSLFKRANGYEYEEVKTMIEHTDEGVEKKRIEKTRKYLAPDTTAQIFWLKNRKKTEWLELEKEKVKEFREKTQIEREKFEFEKHKWKVENEANQINDDVADDGFTDAFLDNVTVEVWENDSGNGENGSVQVQDVLEETETDIDVVET